MVFNLLYSPSRALPATAVAATHLGYLFRLGRRGHIFCSRSSRLKGTVCETVVRTFYATHVLPEHCVKKRNKYRGINTSLKGTYS